MEKNSIESIVWCMNKSEVVTSAKYKYGVKTDI